MINKLDDIVTAKIGERLLPLADVVLSERENLKHYASSLGWERHLLPDLIREIWGTEEAYADEQMLYGKELVKGTLGMGSYSSQLFVEYQTKFNQRCLPSIQKSDEINRHTELRAKLAEVVQEKERDVLNKEAKIFGRNCTNLAFDSAEEVELFITKLLNELMPDFHFDKKLSGKNYLVFSKPFFASWKLLLFFDNRDFFVKLRQCRLNGNLLLCHEKNRGLSKVDQYIHFFPQLLLPRHFTSGAYFTASELETHLRYDSLCWQLALKVFEAPVFSSFEEMSLNGYSN